MTAQIADTLQDVLETRGVAVIVEAAHECMTRAACKAGRLDGDTSRMLGAFARTR